MMQSNTELHKDKLPMLAETLKHMAILLNDMVDLFKIQGGTSTSAWKILKEVVILYWGTVTSGGGSLHCMDQPPLPPAKSDPLHVQRILTNYQVQSLSFLDHLDGHFTDAAHHWSENASLEEDKYIVLACLDKGRGIPASKLDTVFEAYQQTRADDRSRGAGLGLAIVKGLAVDTVWVGASV